MGHDEHPCTVGNEPGIHGGGAVVHRGAGGGDEIAAFIGVGVAGGGDVVGFVVGQKLPGGHPDVAVPDDGHIAPGRFRGLGGALGDDLGDGGDGLLLREDLPMGFLTVDVNDLLHKSYSDVIKISINTKKILDKTLPGSLLFPLCISATLRIPYL